MKSFKDYVQEVAQPLSQGEKNFKEIHGSLTPMNIDKDPKVLGQEHVFKGTKEQVSFKHTPDSDYDKDLKTESVEDIEEEYKDPDKHYAKQSKKMQDAINLHLRKGKSYWEAVRASKVHVKEGWVALGPATKPGEKPKPMFNNLGNPNPGTKIYGDMPKEKASGRGNRSATDIKGMREDVESVEEGKYNWDKEHRRGVNDTMGNRMLNKRPVYAPRKPPADVVKKEDEAIKKFMQKKGMKEEMELDEKTLTPAEMKKREEIVKAMKRKGADKSARTYAIATATAKRVAEEVEMDYEGGMAKAELNAICDKAGVLAEMMSDDMQLEAWLQSKITKAKYMVDSVYDYLMYNEKMADREEDEMPSQSNAMASNYGSFLSRMGEEVEPKKKDNK